MFGGGEGGVGAGGGHRGVPAWVQRARTCIVMVHADGPHTRTHAHAALDRRAGFGSLRTQVALKSGPGPVVQSGVSAGHRLGEHGSGMQPPSAHTLPSGQAAVSPHSAAQPGRQRGRGLLAGTCARVGPGLLPAQPPRTHSCSAARKQAAHHPGGCLPPPTCHAGWLVRRGLPERALGPAPAGAVILEAWVLPAGTLHTDLAVQAGLRGGAFCRGEARGGTPAWAGGLAGRAERAGHARWVGALSQAEGRRQRMPAASGLEQGGQAAD